MKKQIIEQAIGLGRIDKRVKAIKEALNLMSESDLKKAISRHCERLGKRHIFSPEPWQLHRQRVNFLEAMKGTTLNHEAKSSRWSCTGIDYKLFHRPSGNGWVIIAPDEPGNNMYTEDRLLVNLLRKKYANQ